MEEDRFYWFSFLCCVKRRKAIKKEGSKNKLHIGKEMSRLIPHNNPNNGAEGTATRDTTYNHTEQQRTRGSYYLCVWGQHKV